MNSIFKHNLYFKIALLGLIGLLAWPASLHASVSVTAFVAQISNNMVQINWDTESELDQLGYRVWRTTENASQFEAIGSKVLVTDGLIAATGSGRYSATDSTIEAGITYYYWLESIGRAADDVAYDGPRSVQLGGSTGVALAAPPTAIPPATVPPTVQPASTDAPTAPPAVDESPQPVSTTPSAAADNAESPVAQIPDAAADDAPAPTAPPSVEPLPTTGAITPSTNDQVAPPAEQAPASEIKPTVAPQIDTEPAQSLGESVAVAPVVDAPTGDVAVAAPAADAPVVAATAIVAVVEEGEISAEISTSELSQPIASANTATAAESSESAVAANPISGDAADGQPLRIEETRDRLPSQWLWLGMIGSILLVVGSGAAIVLLRRS